jgi:hypothetical protein
MDQLAMPSSAAGKGSCGMEATLLVHTVTVGKREDRLVEIPGEDDASVGHWGAAARLIVFVSFSGLVLVGSVLLLWKEAPRPSAGPVEARVVRAAPPGIGPVRRSVSRGLLHTSVEHVYVLELPLRRAVTEAGARSGEREPDPVYPVGVECFPYRDHHFCRQQLGSRASLQITAEGPEAGPAMLTIRADARRTPALGR